MGKREDLNRHHTIRRTQDSPPRRKIPLPVMLGLIIAVGMMVNVLNGKSYGAAGKAPPPVESGTGSQAEPATPTPDREKLFQLARLVAQGSWGSETRDSCILLAKEFSEAGDKDGAQYLELLAEGALPESAQELIDRLTADRETAESCRRALEKAHQGQRSS